METEKKFTQTLTFKAIIVAWLALMLLIPGAFVQNLIEERQERSYSTIAEINEQWSRAQTLCPPVLALPYSTTVAEPTPTTEEHNLYVAPDAAEIDVQLFPEQRQKGIYKSVVYKSNIHIKGRFGAVSQLKTENKALHFDKAYITLEISDLRGISEEIDFSINGKKVSAKAGSDNFLPDSKSMVIELNDTIIQDLKDGFSFECSMRLKGSSSINFVPIAKNTQVKISGDWTAPGFAGNFLPEYEIDKPNNRFSAKWNVLSFNRNIPDTWTDTNSTATESSFGVNLVDTVDDYQQNMRSAKYALMFVALTFVAFFFVEALTKKRIHFIQYLLVGIALVLFYSLLLSISEQIGFAWAYLIAAAVTISLIEIYVQSIVKDKKTTVILTAILALLYTFLFVVLQLENLALLFGSLGLFLILGIIMFVSSKIQWDKISLPKL